MADRGNQRDSSYPTFRPYQNIYDPNTNSPPIQQSHGGYNQNIQNSPQYYSPDQYENSQRSQPQRSPHTVYSHHPYHQPSRNLNQNLTNRFENQAGGFGNAGGGYNDANICRDQTYDGGEPYTQAQPSQTGININEPANIGSSRSQPKARVMQRAWLKDEQTELAYCWVTCSKDPKKGTSQSEASFWDSICKLFNDRRRMSQPRSVDSLKACWKRLNTLCQKWNDVLTAIQRRQESGANDADYLTKAHERFAADNKGVAFNLEHVYEILKCEEKWSTINKEHTAFRFAPRNIATDSSQGDSETHDDTPLYSTPVRRAAGKQRLKNKVDYSEQYAGLMEHMTSMRTETMELEHTKEEKRQQKWIARQNEKQVERELAQRNHEENMAIQREKIKAKQDVAMMAMLTCDLTKLDPDQREVVKLRIDEYKRSLRNRNEQQ